MSTWHRGEVVNASDPGGLGRVRLRIPSLLGPVESGWIKPMFGVPETSVGDRVFVTFEADGDRLVYVTEAGLGSGGAGLEFDWDDTRLGVRPKGSDEPFDYSELQGPPGVRVSDVDPGGIGVWLNEDEEPDPDYVAVTETALEDRISEHHGQGHLANSVIFNSSGLIVISGTTNVQTALTAVDAALNNRELAGAVSDHEGEPDPHGQYLRLSNPETVDGELDVTGRVRHTDPTNGMIEFTSFSAGPRVRVRDTGGAHQADFRWDSSNSRWVSDADMLVQGLFSNQNPYAIYKRTSGQAIPTGTHTLVTWTTIESSRGSWTATNTTTVTVPASGLYEISVLGDWFKPSGSSSGYGQMTVSVNESGVSGSHPLQVQGAMPGHQGAEGKMSGSRLIVLSQGDVLRVFCFHDLGETVNLHAGGSSPFLMIRRIGEA